MSSRYVPTSYERSTVKRQTKSERHVPVYSDTYPYEQRIAKYREEVPYNFPTRRPLTDDNAWDSYDREARRYSDEIRQNWDDTFRKVAPRADDWSLADDINRRMSPVDFSSKETKYPGMLERTDNRIKEDASGKRTFILEVELSQFEPKEITLKTSGSYLTIHAKHEEKREHNTSKREYSREFLLPREVSPERLTSRLSRTGKLTIEAPLLSSTGKNRDIYIPVDYRY